MAEENETINEPDPGYGRRNNTSDKKEIRVDLARKLEEVARARRLNLNDILANYLTHKNNNDEQQV